VDAARARNALPASSATSSTNPVFGRASWKRDYLITASIGDDRDDVVITFIA